MNEEARIRALVAEGKITDDEAQQLLEALADSEPQPRAKPEEVPQQESGHSADSAAERERFGPGRENEFETGSDASGPWVRIELSAGDLDIRADPALSEPTAEGEVDISREEGGFVIKGRGESPLAGLFGGAARGDVDIRVPQDHSVAIRAAAGDINVQDVRFLRGKVTCGDIEVERIGGVDLVAISGDVDITMTPTRGKHHLKATSGDVRIKLLAGSSVSLSGTAMSGDVRLPEAFKKEGKLVSRKFSGSVGEGNAQFKLQIVSGSLRIEAQDE